MEVSISFSGYSDEKFVGIWTRTFDCRKGVVGRGRRDVISDSNKLISERIIAESKLARLELEVSNSFSGYSYRTVADIWIQTVDCCKLVVGRGRFDVISYSK